MTETDLPVPAQIPEPRAAKLHRIGMFGTVAYLGALLVYAICVWPLLIGMTPHDFADCLAGAFAPVAFFWLVLGFFQQGEELRHSARALYLQGEELRNSVEQQRQLVEVSRLQLDAEREERSRQDQASDAAAQPQLVLVEAGGTYHGIDGPCSFRIMVDSAGPTCSEVKMLVNGSLLTQASVFAAGGRIEGRYDFDSAAEIEPLMIECRYVDARGQAKRRSWVLPLAPAGGPNGRPALGAPQILEFPSYFPA